MIHSLTVKTTPPPDATGRLKEVYDQIAREAGQVPFALQFLSANPDLLQIYWSALRDTTAKSHLTRHQQSLITYEVAKADGCKICKGLCDAELRNLGMNDEEIKTLEKDIKKTTLDQKTKNILIYAYAIAEDPHNKDGVVNAFKQLGMTDEELLEVAVTALWNRNTFGLIHSLGYHSK
jgi:alkylhydroperoxidase family enzyme